MFKKINYVLDKRQKRNLVILLIIIFVGAFVELLGVSAIMPIVNVALNPSTIDNTWYLVEIRDFMGFTQAKEMLTFLAVVVILIYIAKNIYITVMYDLQYRFIFNNQKRLAIKMMDCYMNQNYLFHVSKNIAELQRNVTNDVNGFFTVVLNTLQLLAELSVCIVLVAYLMSQDWLTTLVVAGIVFGVGLLFTFLFRKVLVQKGEENRDLTAQASKWILQAFSGIKEIKVINKEKFFIDNYIKIYDRRVILQRQQSMLKFVPRPILESVCICGLLLAMIIKLQINGSDFTSFITSLSVFVVSAYRMLPSFNRITGYIGAIMFDKPSIDAVYNDLTEIDELMKTKEKAKDSKEKLIIKKDIAMEGISFQYPESDKWILKNASVVINRNSSVAFIGASGAGKTTAVDLLLGLLEPQHGRILVDGVDIRTNIEAWNQCIGYIPQTIYLMDDTIKANIAFGIPEDEIDEKRIVCAMKEAQLDEFVKTLPNGFNTVIGDRGVKLSGGQRQRIGIARALYRDPQVLILDEATSALDNETEKEVMRAIDGLHGQRTMIVIAHRLTTIKNCDVIYEVADGTITEKTHQEIFG